MISFADAFIPLLAARSENSLTDNYDWRRFGAGVQERAAALAEEQDRTRHDIAMIRAHADELEWLWGRLGDDASRSVMVEVLLFRCLGHTKVKLPLNTPEYWESLEYIEKLAATLPRRELECDGWYVSEFDLTKSGYPCKALARPSGLYTQFFLRQYHCVSGERVIGVAPGDTVIDAGGCFGETALYFACMSGPQGKVISAEFGEQNLEIFSANLGLNPTLAPRIEIVKQPLWAAPGVKFSFEGQGPGTHLTQFRGESDANYVSSASIDGIVGEGRCERVDFIKMDIEGAELAALRGAEDTIRRCKPKLAVSIYHNVRDFWEIPRWIASLGLGYRFYIRHFTIHAEETVLFAEAPLVAPDSGWTPQEKSLDLLRSESEIAAGWGQKWEPRVSICCATFNHGKYIAQALSSFLEQRTSFPFEIVVRDDASSDNTAEIVADYAQKYPNLIRLIREEVNQFSLGLRPLHVWPGLARGEFIALCEGDDFWVDPLKLQKQVNLLDAHSDAVMCVAESLICKDHGGKLFPSGVSGKASSTLIQFEDLQRFYFHTSTYCIRRKPFADVISKYFTGHCVFGDTALRFILITLGPFVRLPELVSVYRDTGLGIWTSLGEERQLQWEVDCAQRLISVLSGKHKAFQESKLESLLRRQAALSKC